MRSLQQYTVTTVKTGRHDTVYVPAGELAAWAMQSRLTAEREQFPRVAAAVKQYEDDLRTAIKHGAIHFLVTPIYNK